MQRFLLPLAVLLLGSSLGLEAQVAGPPPNCGVNTLASYETSGPCVLAGSHLEFTGFTFSASTTPGSVSNLDADIVVTPNTIGLGGGFTFSGFQAASVGTGQTATYVIGYTYSILPDPPTGMGASISGDPPFGNVTISESICADSSFGSSPAVCQNTLPSQSLMINDTNPPKSLQASIVLNPVVTRFATIQDTIVLGPSTCAIGPCAGFDGLTANNFVGEGNPVIPASGTCDGVYDQPFNGNVTVPSGDTCVLVSSSVGGNITVQGTGTLTC